MDTSRLIIADRQHKDIPVEEQYRSLYPELEALNPSVGEFRNPMCYSVFLKETGTHIGTCSLYNFATTEVELGVMIFIPEYWNMGYGTEIVNALCEYVFACFSPITTIVAKTPVYNTRAVRCYEKCGFIEHTRALVGGYEMIYMSKHLERGL